MCKNKQVKFEKIPNSKINEMYSAYPICKNCKFGCVGIFKGETCVNKIKEYTLNEIIEKINDNNLNIKELCKRKGLSYSYMKDFLKALAPMPYDYYSAILEELKHPDYNFLEKEFMNSQLVKEMELVNG